jgi:hypothetical protein
MGVPRGFVDQRQPDCCRPASCSSSVGVIIGGEDGPYGALVALGYLASIGVTI